MINTFNFQSFSMLLSSYFDLKLSPPHPQLFIKSLYPKKNFFLCQFIPWADISAHLSNLYRAHGYIMLLIWHPSYFYTDCVSHQGEVFLIICACSTLITVFNGTLEMDSHASVCSCLCPNTHISRAGPPHTGAQFLHRTKGS